MFEENPFPIKKEKKDQPEQRQKEAIEVTEDNLPLYCPLPGAQLWCEHPRVYLSIKPKEEIQCPYCGLRYRLGAPSSQHK